MSLGSGLIRPAKASSLQPSPSVQGVIIDNVSTTRVTILTLLRVVRVLRIVKLVPKAKGLKTMMMTLMWSLPALFNVATVLFLFMFIYVSVDQFVWSIEV